MEAGASGANYLAYYLIDFGRDGGVYRLSSLREETKVIVLALLSLTQRLDWGFIVYAV